MSEKSGTGIRVHVHHQVSAESSAESSQTAASRERSLRQTSAERRVRQSTRVECDRKVMTNEKWRVARVCDSLVEVGTASTWSKAGFWGGFS